jgi:hypothetical protein
MATAAKIDEMSQKFNALRNEFVPVEDFFKEYLDKYMFEKIAKGEMPSVNLFRDFDLILVSSTHAIFYSPEDTVFDRETNEVEHVLSTNVSVPLIYMAKAVK